MSDVPDELLREILSRLPVAPLLRFRCVSKSWKGLIDDQQFIKHHLNHSRKTNSNLNIILSSRHLYSVDFDLVNETDLVDFKELSHPLKTPSGETEILGLCDGLLVLRNNKDDDTILWNPSVRRFHAIPCSGIEILGYDKHSSYGFGYDVMSDDYKLISIVQFYGEDEDGFNSEVKVYSLKSNSWRTIPDFPYYIKFQRAYNKFAYGKFANGSLHWIVCSKVKLYTEWLVAAFDLRTEEYRLLPLPQFAGGDYKSMNVAVLGGYFSVICYVKRDRVDVWAMKEYGVQESWSILFTFDLFDDFEILTPLAYSKCGRKVLVGLDDCILFWYDVDKKSTNFARVRVPSTSYNELHSCLQSLVLFNSGTCDFDLFHQEKNKNGRAKREVGE